MEPRSFKIVEMKKELSDTLSMSIAPVDGKPVSFAPGQFNMLYAYGIGEIPISISGDPGDTSVYVHTTRKVGKVTAALNALQPGAVIGVRGPFGTSWPLAPAEGKDIVFVAGGIGLAPLRPAIYAAMQDRQKFGNIVVLVGARTPEDMLYSKELLRWRSRFDIDVQVTVDRATGNWHGRVGLVTALIPSGGFDPDNAIAYVCGPEVMMRHVIEALYTRGVTQDRIYISMERNMKCGVGFCGHCQWGSQFVCRDGPVFRCDKILNIANIREL